MKNITALLVLLVASTFNIQATEVTGESVYSAKCAMCHSMTMPKSKKDMKAPPLSKVSAKLKFDFENNQTKIVEFIEDYIQNPDRNKSHCMPMALKKFGLMPSIGKAMSLEERKAVSEWTFSNFDEKWDTGVCQGSVGKCAGDKKCSGEQKCGDSKKCGHDKKCGSDHKCGDNKKSEHNKKCASGKCGGDKK